MSRPACVIVRHALALAGQRRARTIAADAACARTAAVWAHTADIRRRIAANLRARAAVEAQA